LDQDNVYLSGGLKPGERIIISPIKGAANGLKIRIAGEKADSGKQFESENNRKLKRPEGERKRPEGASHDSRQKSAERAAEEHKETQ
ncbi:MAG: hypothetical protein HOG45_07855, partial [Deltaproteobacteria bacterium]|nr:hypothetical protein [Deltaproteobacteria bacterium]